MNDINTTKKQLKFRAWHRGSREMDLLMGSFADEYLPDMDTAETAAFAEMLDIDDDFLYRWYARREEAPANAMTPMLEKFLAHTYPGARVNE